MDALALRCTERIAGFASFLHANGFDVGGGDAATVLRTAEHAGLLDGALMRWSLKALLCGRGEEWRRFDALFDAWFLPANRWQRPVRREREAAGLAGAHAEAGDDSALPVDEREQATPRDRASRHTTLSSADFRTLTEREHLLDIEALMRRFARRLRQLQLRREQAALRGRRLDVAGTIRRSVASGGTPFRLAWRRRRTVRPRLVLLVDVSRSMLLYSFFYLRLARAMAAEMPDVHSFIFHTRCTAVSQALHDADPWRAQEQMHLLAQGWGGGTRIGESLAQFNREHAARLVHRHTAVVVLSDGYDTGAPARLAGELAALHRRARRIVWLNPLAGRSGFAPVSQGLQSALPHVDLHAPAPDLASLEAVLPRLVDTLH